ncbi:MAG: hypothetical protein JWQ35_970 [Bacteriovoracaceae bacterium]|nr:hypothetical protein [Bacteriovoracaceae bacterium]
MSTSTTKETSSNDKNYNTTAKPTTQADRDLYIKDTNERLQKIATKTTETKNQPSSLIGDLKTKADENRVKREAKYNEIKTKISELKYSTDEKWAADKQEIERFLIDADETSKAA